MKAKLNMLKCLITIIVILSSRLGFSQDNTIHKDSLILYYESNKYKVPASAEQKIKQKLLNRTIKRIDIYGYTDYVGSNVFNDALALKRAQMVSNIVKKYSAIDALNIISMGETYSRQDSTNYPKGVLEDRKVVCYISYTDTLEDLKLQTSPENYLKKLNTLKIGESIVLRNILFYLGKAIIIPSSLPELELLLQTLENNPNLYIEIIGHVCCGSYDEIENKEKYEYETEYEYEAVLYTNSYDYNKTLSLNRAEAIKRHLKYKGIDPKRIVTKGMGFSNPLYFPEKSEDDKLSNRRIEVVVLKK